MRVATGFAGYLNKNKTKHRPTLNGGPAAMETEVVAATGTLERMGMAIPPTTTKEEVGMATLST